MYKICHSYCWDPEDREDLAQEIVIHLWKSSARYDGQYRLSTWIYRVALNVAISFYRREIRRKQGVCPIDESIMDLDKTRTALKKFIMTPFLGVIIGIALQVMLGSFIYNHISMPEFVIPAALIYLFALMQTISASINPPSYYRSIMI
ncbi:MAG: sigma-70 family RNA polymerase sigma factor [Gemmatimonadota bacterium]|nr:sigma-70 family RNA polymerase sigma factor [Gemmatimonadota bacterium]